MKYQVEENCLTIFLPGELDHHNAEEIRKGADNMMEKRNIRSIVFDFSNTNFMDSSGIGVIIGRCKNLGYSGGDVSACHLNERVDKIFTVSGLKKIIQVKE